VSSWPKAGCVWCVPGKNKCFAVTGCSGGRCTAEYGAKPCRPTPVNDGRPISSTPVLHHPIPTLVASAPEQGHPVSPPQNNPVILEKERRRAFRGKTLNRCLSRSLQRNSTLSRTLCVTSFRFCKRCVVIRPRCGTSRKERPRNDKDPDYKHQDQAGTRDLQRWPALHRHAAQKMYHRVCCGVSSPPRSMSDRTKDNMQLGRLASCTSSRRRRPGATSPFGP
jgi:hypothetical protein